MSDPSREAEMEPVGTQRLDKWLWFVRVVKSRTQAAALVTDGKVRINRVRAEKPSHNLKPGDVVTVSAHRQVRVLRMVAAGERRGPPAEAQRLYEELTEARTPAQNGEAGAAGPGSAQTVQREPGTGRPTKRDRRAFDALRGRRG